MTPKKYRLQRIFHSQQERALVIPIDHGLTIGPVAGIESIEKMLYWIGHSAITGVIAHKGIAEKLIEKNALKGAGLFIHLNGMPSQSLRPNDKILLTSIEHALRLGADGVSLQTNFDGSNDRENLEMLGRVVDESARYALPVLAMVYDKRSFGGKGLRELIRIAIEMGVDAVKVAPAEGELDESLSDVAQDIPILVAGGELGSLEKLSHYVESAIRSGAKGVCIGRNVFQRSDVHNALNQLEKIILNDCVQEEIVERRWSAIH